jgi:hypothetical protein
VLLWMWFQYHLTDKILNYCISLPSTKGVWPNVLSTSSN